jgi:hypothetical protein
MPGPRPTPTHLRLLRGNPGKRPLPKHEPRPAGDLLHAPDWISSDRQKAAWAYAIANIPPGLLKMIDRDVLAIHIAAMDTVVECQSKIAETGLVVVSRNRGAV